MAVIEAVLLAAGLGTRLRPFTDRLPKALLTVGDRTVLDHNLYALRKAGVRRVFVNTHYHAQEVESYVEAHEWGMEVWTRRQTLLNGPAGGAAIFREDFEAKTVLVVSADAVHAVDLPALAERHSSCRSLLTVAVREVTDPSRFGVPELAQGDRITAFVEKPQLATDGPRVVSCGIYCVECSLLNAVNCNEDTDFGRHLIPRLANAGHPVFAFRTTDYWIDMGTPEALRRANLDAALGLFDSRPSGRRSGASWIADSARIHSSAQIEGPVLIGERVIIDRAVTVRGPAVIGRDCRLGSASQIHEAVMLPGAQMPAGAFLACGVVG